LDLDAINALPSLDDMLKFSTDDQVRALLDAEEPAPEPAPPAPAPPAPVADSPADPAPADSASTDDDDEWEWN
jgi:hypothetical protein